MVMRQPPPTHTQYKCVYKNLLLLHSQYGYIGTHPCSDLTHKHRDRESSSKKPNLIKQLQTLWRVINDGCNSFCSSMERCITALIPNYGFGWYVSKSCVPPSLQLHNEALAFLKELNKLSTPCFCLASADTWNNQTSVKYYLNRKNVLMSWATQSHK